MKNKPFASRLLLLSAVLLPSTCLAQPLCFHHDSLDWLVIDSPVIVRAKVSSLGPIEKHPKLSEMRLEILESIRGDAQQELRVPIEKSREEYWVKKSVETQGEFLLFLVKTPRGYAEPEVKKVIDRYERPLYYFWRIDLTEPQRVLSLDFKQLQDGPEILKRVRKLARHDVVRRELGQPKPKRFTFRLRNSDSLTVPLNDRIETKAAEWAKSSDETLRYYGKTVQFGFKDHRNKPFESGYWYAKLKCPGGDIRFGLRLDKDDSGQPYVLVINGAEAIRVEDVELTEEEIRIEFPHYDSVITADVDRKSETMTGTWHKVTGKGKSSELKFSASTKSDRQDADFGKPPIHYKFYGTWSVKFSETEDLAVAEFDFSNRGNFYHKDVRQYQGKVMTTTGDYRYMAGDQVDGKLELSVFDGAHAFLLRAEFVEKGKLKGDFWSRDNWHETWTATHDVEAKLPNAFEQTRWTGDAKLGDLKFPNLEGKLLSLADKSFAGKVRLITVFGSWCPNCHDSAEYLSYLHKVYGDQGLSIVGLAFELTGDFERDAEQVRRYVQRHDIQYPILLAGLADKAEASKKLPILDRVRSYPTTIFLNSKNEVISIHTGFTGPATVTEYDDLKTKFEAIIRKQLRF